MLQVSPGQRTLLNLILVVGVAAVITGSLLPGNSPVMAAVGKLPLTDKALHFLAYMALSTVAALARTGLRAAMTFAIGLALMGGALELAQSLVPGRTPELADEGANVLGAFCGIILARLAGGRHSPARLRP